MLVFLPPSLITAAPVPAKAVAAVLEALEGIPECLTDGKPAQLAKAVRTARAVWNRHEREVSPVLEAGARARLSGFFSSLDPHSGLKAAEEALDASDSLATLLPLDRNSRLAAADRACMRAWIRVAGKHWDAIPDLDGAFKPFLDEGRPGQGEVLVEVKARLAAFHAGLSARRVAETQRPLSRLLELVDVLEKSAP